MRARLLALLTWMNALRVLGWLVVVIVGTIIGDYVAGQVLG